MKLSTKAVFAALVLSLTPALASAQGFPLTHFGPGVGMPPSGGIVAPGWVPAPNHGFPRPTPVPTQVQDCGAAHAQSLIGVNAYAAFIPGNVRIIGPDTIVTRDYRADRLNLATDYNGIIQRVYCG